MRLFQYSVVVAIAAYLFAFIGLTPAAATTIDQARALCRNNPNCWELPSVRGEFCIRNGRAWCDRLVKCPTNGGACKVIYIRPGGGQQQLGSKSVSQVLAAAPKATLREPGSKGGTLAPGLLDGGGGLTQTGGPAAAGSPARAPSAPSGPSLR